MILQHLNRLELLSRVEHIAAERPEWPLTKVLSYCKVSRATYYRLLNKPAQATQRARAGRKPAFTLNDTEVARFRYLVAKYDSVDFAAEKFWEDPACTHETRTKILEILERCDARRIKRRFPTSLHQQVRITPAERAELRGERTSEAMALSPSIGMFIRDEHGRDIPIKANKIWMADDESGNQPYLVPFTPHRNFADKIDPRYCWKLCRQLLKFKDLYSATWLGVMAVGRERDQYRAEDILRALHWTILSRGTMPDELIFEQGRWMGNAIRGIEVSDGHRLVRWGGIDELMRITYVHSSRGKAWLESDLNLSQRSMAHQGEDIGRTRGEFELATKHWLQIQRQARMLEKGEEFPRVLRDPLALGFLKQEEVEQLQAQSMFELNCRPKQRAAFGSKTVVPNDLVEDSIPLRPLPPEHAWRFYPIKEEKVISGGGKIVKSVKEYDRIFQFVVNGVLEGVHLENGYRVLIAFDPIQPQLGCIIANAEIGTKNRNRYAFGEIIMTAPLLQDAPIRDDSEDYSRPNYKKRASAAVTSGFAAPKKHFRDERSARIRQVYDGKGTMTRVSNQPESPVARDSSPRSPRPKARTVDLDRIAAREAALLADEIYAG